MIKRKRPAWWFMEEYADVVQVENEKAPPPFDPNDHDARVKASETRSWEDALDDERD